VLDRVSMREKLAGLSVAQPAHRIVCALSEAREAVEALGMPVAVIAASDTRGARERRVDYAADLPLALSQVKSDCSDERVVIEEWLTGSWFTVVVRDGESTMDSIFAWEAAPMHHRFASRIVGPVELPSPLKGEVESCCRAVLEAVPFGSDESAIDLCVHGGSPHVMAMGSAERWSELFAAMGATSESLQGDGKVAAQWLRSRSGIVIDIAGVDEARSMDGIVSVQVGVALGDSVGHVVDSASRDRLGLVVAVGETLDEARGRAKAARDRIAITTQTIL